MTTTHQQAAAAFFRARLTFQTDVSDVHAALTANHRPAPSTSTRSGPSLAVGSGQGSVPSGIPTVVPGPSEARSTALAMDPNVTPPSS